jgi:hypothetical protein
MSGSVSSMSAVMKKEAGKTALYFQTSRCIPDCQGTPACENAQGSSCVPTNTSKNDKYSHTSSPLILSAKR